MTLHLEKIAREIYADRWSGGDIDDAPDYFADEARQAARAALSALLPPSEEMVQAMMAIAPPTPNGPFSFYDATRVWNAAIKVILSENPNKSNLILAEGEGKP